MSERVSLCWLTIALIHRGFEGLTRNSFNSIQRFAKCLITALMSLSSPVLWLKTKTKNRFALHWIRLAAGIYRFLTFVCFIIVIVVFLTYSLLLSTLSSGMCVFCSFIVHLLLPFSYNSLLWDTHKLNTACMLFLWIHLHSSGLCFSFYFLFFVNSRAFVPICLSLNNSR